jgi:hypothetical protein
LPGCLPLASRLVFAIPSLGDTPCPLATRVYVETLREWLNQAKLAGFSHSFENPNLLGSVWARYGQVVEAGRLIVFN